MREVRAAGFDAVVNTNGALLTPERGAMLLEHGVTMVYVNGSEIGPEYESLYRLPFDKVSANVRSFAEMAAGRLSIVLVDHQHDPQHEREVEQYWRAQGVKRFFRFQL